MTLQLGVQNLFDKHFFAAEAAAGRTYSLHIGLSFLIKKTPSAAESLPRKVFLITLTREDL